MCADVHDAKNNVFTFSDNTRNLDWHHNSSLINLWPGQWCRYWLQSDPYTLLVWYKVRLDWSLWGALILQLIDFGCYRFPFMGKMSLENFSSYHTLYALMFIATHFFPWSENGSGCSRKHQWTTSRTNKTKTELRKLWEWRNKLQHTNISAWKSRCVGW